MIERKKIIELRDDFIAISIEREKSATLSRYEKDKKLENYHRGAKNICDLAIVKLNEILGIYKEIEEGVKNAEKKL